MIIKLYLNTEKDTIVKYELLTERALFEQLSVMEQITFSEIGTLDEDPSRLYEIVDTDFLSDRELNHYVKICTMLVPIFQHQQVCFAN